MSKVSLDERARLYVQKIPPAVSGSGGHNATFTVACALVKGFGLSIDEARPILAEWNLGCSPVWSPAELEHKLRQADTARDERERGYLRDKDSERDDAPGQGRPASSAASAPLPTPEPVKPAFQEEKLKAFAARWRGFIDTAWLADRSPVMPVEMSADAYLRAVFREGERVVIFTNQMSQGQAMWPLQAIPATGDAGVWYLAQPVDGIEHVNPRAKVGEDGSPKMSRRSEESVTAWRHLVLESDDADPRDWMGAIVQIPFPITAIYTSGGRSIHALVRLDAPTKQEWDNQVRQIRPTLVTLGADPKAMSAVRLTRLPGAWREGTFREIDGKKVYVRYRAPALQKLLYLNPEPEAQAICALGRQRDVVGHWETLVTAALKMTPDDVRECGEWQMVEECERALEWLQSSPGARALLTKLRAWMGGGNES
jgi:hypothetical protein